MRSTSYATVALLLGAGYTPKKVKAQGCPLTYSATYFDPDCKVLKQETPVSELLQGLDRCIPLGDGFQYFKTTCDGTSFGYEVWFDATCQFSTPTVTKAAFGQCTFIRNPVTFESEYVMVKTGDVSASNTSSGGSPTTINIPKDFDINTFDPNNFNPADFGIDPNNFDPNNIRIDPSQIDLSQFVTADQLGGIDPNSIDLSQFGDSIDPNNLPQFDPYSFDPSQFGPPAGFDSYSFDPSQFGPPSGFDSYSFDPYSFGPPPGFDSYSFDPYQFGPPPGFDSYSFDPYSFGPPSGFDSYSFGPPSGFDSYSFDPYSFGPPQGFDSYSFDPYSFGPPQGFDSYSFDPYSFGPPSGFDSYSFDPYSFGPPSGFDSYSFDPYSFGPPQGFDQYSFDPYQFGPPSGFDSYSFDPYAFQTTTVSTNVNENEPLIFNPSDFDTSTINQNPSLPTIGDTTTQVPINSDSSVFDPANDIPSIPTQLDIGEFKPQALDLPQEFPSELPSNVPDFSNFDPSQVDPELMAQLQNIDPNNMNLAELQELQNQLQQQLENQGIDTSFIPQTPNFTIPDQFPQTLDNPIPEQFPDLESELHNIEKELNETLDLIDEAHQEETEEVLKVDKDDLHHYCSLKSIRFFHDANCQEEMTTQPEGFPGFDGVNQLLQRGDCFEPHEGLMSKLQCYDKDFMLWGNYLKEQDANCSGEFIVTGDLQANFVKNNTCVLRPLGTEYMIIDIVPKTFEFSNHYYKPMRMMDEPMMDEPMMDFGKKFDNIPEEVFDDLAQMVGNGYTAYDMKVMLVTNNDKTPEEMMQWIADQAGMPVDQVVMAITTRMNITNDEMKAMMYGVRDQDHHMSHNASSMRMDRVPDAVFTQLAEQMNMTTEEVKEMLMQNSDKSPDEMFDYIANQTGMSQDQLAMQISSQMDMSPEQLRAMMNGYDDHTISQMGQHDGMHDSMNGMNYSMNGMHDGMYDGMHGGMNSKDDDMFEKFAPFLMAKMNMTEEELKAFQMENEGKPDDVQLQLIAEISGQPVEEFVIDLAGYMNMTVEEMMAQKPEGHDMQQGDEMAMKIYPWLMAKLNMTQEEFMSFAMKNQAQSPDAMLAMIADKSGQSKEELAMELAAYMNMTLDQMGSMMNDSPQSSHSPSTNPLEDQLLKNELWLRTKMRMSSEQFQDFVSQSKYQHPQEVLMIMASYAGMDQSAFISQLAQQMDMDVDEFNAALSLYDQQAQGPQGPQQPQQINVMDMLGQIPPRTLDDLFRKMGTDQAGFETFIMSNSDISPEELIQIVADRSGQTKESLVAEISASMNMTSEQFIARMHGYDDYTISQMGPHQQGGDSKLEAVAPFLEQKLNMPQEQIMSIVEQNQHKSPEEMIKMLADMANQSEEEFFTEMAAYLNMTPEQLVASMQGYDDHTVSQMGQYEQGADEKLQRITPFLEQKLGMPSAGVQSFFTSMMNQGKTQEQIFEQMAQMAGQSEEQFFADMADFLNMSPEDLKAMMEEDKNDHTMGDHSNMGDHGNMGPGQMSGQHPDEGIIVQLFEKADFNEREAYQFLKDLEGKNADEKLAFMAEKVGQSTEDFTVEFASKMDMSPTQLRGLMWGYSYADVSANEPLTPEAIEKWEGMKKEWENLMIELTHEMEREQMRDNMMQDSNHTMHDGDNMMHDRDQMMHDGDQMMHDGDQMMHDGDQMMHDGDMGDMRPKMKKPRKGYYHEINTDCVLLSQAYFADKDCTMPLPYEQMNNVHLTPTPMMNGFVANDTCDVTYNHPDQKFRLKCYDDNSMIFLQYNATTDPTCQSFIDQGTQAPYHVKTGKCTKVPDNEGYMIWNIETKENIEWQEELRQELKEDYRNKLSSSDDQATCAIDMIQMFHDSNCRYAFDQSGYKNYPAISKVNEWIQNGTCTYGPSLNFTDYETQQNDLYFETECLDNTFIFEFYNTHCNESSSYDQHYFESGHCYPVPFNGVTAYMMPSIQPAGIKEQVVVVDDSKMHQDCTVTKSEYFHDENCQYPYNSEVSERDLEEANYVIQNDVCMSLSETTESSMQCYDGESIIYNFYQSTPLAECNSQRSTSWDKQAIIMPNNTCTRINSTAYIKNEIQVIPAPVVEPLPTIDLTEEFYDPEVPFEEQATKRTEQFTNNIAASVDIFSTLEYPDVPETECFAEMNLYKQANAFDFTCTVEDEFAGEETSKYKAIALAYYNEATKGSCVAIPEPELLGPYSIRVECKKNGFKVWSYKGLSCAEPVERAQPEFWPWNFCNKGQFKAKYRKPIQQVDLYQSVDSYASRSPLGSDEYDTSANGEEIPKKQGFSDTVVIVGGVIATICIIAIVSVVTYFCVRGDKPQMNNSPSKPYSYYQKELNTVQNYTTESSSINLKTDACNIMNKEEVELSVFDQNNVSGSSTLKRGPNDA